MQNVINAPRMQRLTGWMTVPVFFCLIAPFLARVPVLKGTGLLYMAMSLTLTADLICCFVVFYAVRIRATKVQVGYGPTFGRANPLGVLLDMRIVPLTYSIRFPELGDGDPYTDAALQVKRSLSMVCGKFAAAAGGLILLGPAKCLSLLLTLPNMIVALVAGPSSLYREIGLSIITDSMASLVGHTFLVWSVLNLLPIPFLPGGDFGWRLLGVALRRDVYSWLVLTGPIYVRALSFLCMLATFGSGLWIALRAAYSAFLVLLGT